PTMMVGSLLGITVAAMEGAIAWLVKPAMDDVFIRRDMAMVKIIPILFLGAYVAKGLARYGHSYLMAAGGERGVPGVRRDLFAHVQRMPLSFFAGRHSAEISSRIVTDVNRMARLSSTVLVMTIRNIVMVVVLAGIMVARDWGLALIALVVFPFIAVTVRSIGRKLYRVNRRSQRRGAEVNVPPPQALTGTKDGKGVGRRADQRGGFGRLTQGP